MMEKGLGWTGKEEPGTRNDGRRRGRPRDMWPRGKKAPHLEEGACYLVVGGASKEEG